jgi:hypothetical protein
MATTKTFERRLSALERKIPEPAQYVDVEAAALSYAATLAECDENETPHEAISVHEAAARYQALLKGGGEGGDAVFERRLSALEAARNIRFHGPRRRRDLRRR